MEQDRANGRSLARLFTSKNVTLLVCCLIAMTAAFLVALLANGIGGISLSDIFNAIFHHNPDSAQHRLITEMRLPVAVNAILYGAAMGVAGVLLQRATSIQAVCPSTLGLAPTGMLALMLIAHYRFDQLNEWMIAGVCILGAGCGLLAAYLASLAVPMKMPGMRRLIGGLVVAGIIGMVLFVMQLQWREDEWLALIRNGVHGNPVMLPVGLVCILLCMGLSGRMNESSHNTPMWLIGGCLVLAVVLSGTAIMTLGNWAFAGLIASAFARWLAGREYRMIVPVAAMAGAVLVSGLNTISYYMAPPLEITLSIATSLIGLPVFVVLVWKEAVRYIGRQGGCRSEGAESE